MNKKFLVLLGFILSVITIETQAQNDPVLMKINGNPVTKSEFEYVYNKNNTESSIEKKSLDDYLKLFVDFKLKTEEAKSLGIDTTRQFIREYTVYKDQLIQPYLSDSITEQEYARKIYDRYKENIEVSHILIKFDKAQLFPADTLDAYNKAMEVRARLVGKKAESFDKVAKDISEDPYAKVAAKPGHLGWTTTMMFVAPFEDAMYSLAVNEISMPVRSNFGYHLIKVDNKRPDKGLINVAHIMLGFTQQDPSQAEQDSLLNLANDIYKKLGAGGDYAQLCGEYSIDRQSASKGGDIGWFGVEARLPEEFKAASFDLKNVGDYSKPVKTPYGYHILKLIDRKERDSWDTAKSSFIAQIKRSDKVVMMNKLKKRALEKKFDCIMNTTEWNNLKELANTVFPTDSVFISSIAENNNNLLTLQNKGYSVKDFSKYIAKNKFSQLNVSTDVLEDLYSSYLFSLLQDAEKDRIVKSSPELKNLVQEYHDGILLFDIMNKEVWEKAANDTIGLQNYFNTHKSEYKWDSKKFKGMVIHCKDEDALKRVKDVIKKNKKSLDLRADLMEAFKSDTVQVVRVERGLWSEGENKYVDYEIINKGKGDKPAPLDKYPLFIVEGRFINAPEDYTDVKGLVVSDYQDKLEKEWIEYLRKKYPVEINQQVLSTIKE